MMRSCTTPTPAQLTAMLEEAGLSPEQFAHLANVNHKTIRRYEAGIGRPHRSTVRRLRVALDDLEAQMNQNRNVPRWG